MSILQEKVNLKKKCNGLQKKKNVMYRLKY